MAILKYKLTRSRIFPKINDKNPRNFIPYFTLVQVFWSPKFYLLHTGCLAEYGTYGTSNPTLCKPWAYLQAYLKQKLVRKKYDLIDADRFQRFPNGFSNIFKLLLYPHG
jgi:hypothetical protein